MRIPFWKKWLSYAVPVILEETGSNLNPELSVRLDQGRVQLLSGNAIYSWDDLYRNFTVGLGRLDLEGREYHDILLLGLGLGSVPYILEKVYGQHYHFTAVEWDEVVADMAYRYTLSRLESPVEIITADAGIFIEVCEEKFDLVIIDIFEDHKTPSRFETAEFLEKCRQHLRPGGMVLYNRLYHTSEDREHTEHFFEETFEKVFNRGSSIDTDGNWILVGPA